MIVAAAIGLVLATLLVAPHRVRQDALAPTTGIALWTAVLILRATVSLSLMVIAVLFVPATDLFTALTHWCLHAVLPFLATHLGFDGHLVGDAAVIVPGLLIAASLVSVSFGLWRGSRAVHRWLRSSSLGPGPGESVIVGDAEVIVAAAGLRAPRIVVSTGALLRLDDAELSAGLEHEWGHVERRHRLFTVLAEVGRALSPLLPGGRGARDHLGYHLERDADDYAVQRTGDPLALASAICKAAQRSAGAPSSLRSGPALVGLGGSGAAERLRLLVDGSTGNGKRASLAARALIGAIGFAVVGIIVATPALAGAGIEQLGTASAHAALDCG